VPPGSNRLLAWTEDGVWVDDLGAATAQGNTNWARSWNTAARPSLASAGDRVYAVWEDDRAGGERRRAHGALLDADGVPLASLPTQLALGDDSAIFPAVAFDGASFLVAWVNENADDDDGVQVLRVGADGVPLDTAPLTVAPQAHMTLLHPAVTAGSDGFLVTWTVSTWRTGLDVMGVRIGSDGTLLDPSPVVIAGGDGDQLGGAAVADGGRYLVVWTDGEAQGEAEVRGAFVPAEGPIDLAPFSISTTIDGLDAPQIAAGNGAFQVLWETSDDLNHQLLTAAVPAQGPVTPSAGQAVGGVIAGYSLDISLASDGSSFLAVASVDPDEPGTSVWATRIGADGLPLGDMIEISEAEVGWQGSSVASPGSNRFVFAYDHTGPEGPVSRTKVRTRGLTIQP
jgi:hypothetical protein